MDSQFNVIFIDVIKSMMRSFRPTKTDKENFTRHNPFEDLVSARIGVKSLRGTSWGFRRKPALSISASCNDTSPEFAADVIPSF